MKALIIEDELHNTRLLSGMIQKIRPEWEIVGTLESVQESVEFLNKEQQPDVIFMDIQLSDGTCFSIFDEVEVNSLVIFTTAYDEYAIKSFKVNSIDYLLKPISEELLLDAVLKFEKFYEKMNVKINTDYGKLVELLKTSSYRKRFMVNGGKSLIKIEVENIAYFLTEDHATFIYTFDGNQYLLDSTMEKLEVELDPERFFRTGRGTIINIASIEKVDAANGGKLIVNLVSPLGNQVKVSRLKAAAFKAWIDK
ncbi:MAG: DNA-binding response regulator [Salinivirgaceae bacterium]|nr:MAG: DNA-binding response regulator [Salinivirgaceae bacterium]